MLHGSNQIRLELLVLISLSALIKNLRTCVHFMDPCQVTFKSLFACMLDSALAGGSAFDKSLMRMCLKGKEV